MDLTTDTLQNKYKMSCMLQDVVHARSNLASAIELIRDNPFLEGPLEHLIELKRELTYFLDDWSDAGG